MKEATTPTLKIHIPKIADIGIENVGRVTFIFKAFMIKTAPAIITQKYPDNVSFDSATNCFCMDLSESDTRKFGETPRAYMDTRIVLKNGKIPETSIVQIDVNGTLFSEEDTA